MRGAKARWADGARGQRRPASAVTQCVLSVLTGDGGQSTDQSEPGSVAGSVCPVRGCAPMRSAGDLNASWLATSRYQKNCLARFYALAAPSSLLRYWRADVACRRRRG